jgi:putative mRNA 3-end processing factor
MLVKKLDFSSHLDRKDLFSFVKKRNPEKIFCVHGDDTVTFANELKNEGFDAVAPVTENRVFNIE